MKNTSLLTVWFGYFHRVLGHLPVLEEVPLKV